jgi:hypothetical protein
MHSGNLNMMEAWRPRELREENTPHVIPIWVDQSLHQTLLYLSTKDGEPPETYSFYGYQYRRNPSWAPKNGTLQ